jgi:hypothetical protein
MVSKSVKMLVCLVAVLNVWSPRACHAERDPEAAARQAKIDEGLAEDKVRELQRDQAIAADVQIDNSSEIAARGKEIAELQAQAENAELRRLQAEGAEK